MDISTSLVVVGNLTNDPDLRETGSGVPVINFTIAANPRRFNKDTKEWEDSDPVFQRCTLFGAAAKNVADSVTKGMRVIAVGELRAENWVDNEGIKRTDKVLYVSEVAVSLKFSPARVSRGERATSQTPSYDVF